VPLKDSFHWLIGGLKDFGIFSSNASVKSVKRWCEALQASPIIYGDTKVESVNNR